jgi:hypothetical protein
MQHIQYGNPTSISELRENSKITRFSFSRKRLVVDQYQAVYIRAGWLRGWGTILECAGIREFGFQQFEEEPVLQAMLAQDDELALLMLFHAISFAMFGCSKNQTTAAIPSFF